MKMKNRKREWVGTAGKRVTDADADAVVAQRAAEAQRG